MFSRFHSIVGVWWHAAWDRFLCEWVSLLRLCVLHSKVFSSKHAFDECKVADFKFSSIFVQFLHSFSLTFYMYTWTFLRHDLMKLQKRRSGDGLLKIFPLTTLHVGSLITFFTCLSYPVNFLYYIQSNTYIFVCRYVHMHISTLRICIVCAHL